MKKILLIASIFLLSSCNNNSIPENTTTTGTTTEIATNTNPSNLEKYTETLKNSSKKITETEEFNSCLQPYVNMCVQSVASDLAHKNGNPEMCNELSDITAKSGCQLGVILSLMYTDKENYRKAESCDIISDESLKNTCKSHILTLNISESQDISKCDEVAKLYTNQEEASSAKDSCILNVATKRKKTENCATISSEIDKKSCETTIEMQKLYEEQSKPVSIQ